MEFNLTHYVNKFNEEHIDEKSRGKAFDCIHDAFIDALNRGEPDYDYLSLHLYAYLACWDMIDYKKFLREKNYKVLKNTVVELYKKAINDYKYLKNYDLDLNYVKEYKNAILDLKKIIVKNISREYEKDIHVTDTLIGKILLGTFGCMPAFDTHFCKTAKEVFKLKTITIENCIEKVLEFAIDNKSELVALQNGYPIMKIVDMAFWEYGK